MSTVPTPESENTSRAANHSFPSNTSRNSETRRKRKSGSLALSQLLPYKERKIEQVDKAVQQKEIMSTKEDEDYPF
jgi:hypothetical protein